MRVWLFLALLWLPVAAVGQTGAEIAAQTSPQGLAALARLDPAASRIADRRGGVGVTLALSQPVPWRVRVLDAPPRLILDMREVDWAGLDRIATDSRAVVSARAGVVRSGWSRLVLELAGPYLVTRAEMQTGDGRARVVLRLDPASKAAFAARAGLAEPDLWALPAVASPPLRALRDDTVVVVLDPGHGGIDPGAQSGGHTEADLMLTFARELKDLLLRDGRFSVLTTRDADDFVPLEARISIARAAGADVFLSLHADALTEGEAVGATIYTLSQQASDTASQTLAERHDRDDLLSGVDLTAQDDLVATVLMDMARVETWPRIDRLAVALESAIKAAGLTMHRHPRQKAAFSVLKSPDIPAVLVELGFMSSTRDLARLVDPAWRSTMAGALRAALVAWAEEDAALYALRRD